MRSVLDNLFMGWNICLRAEIFICVLHMRVTVVIAAHKIVDEFSTDSYITNNKCVIKTLLLDLWSLQVRQTISKNIYFFYYRWMLDA